MIVIAGTIPVRPEQRDEALRVARVMAEATRAEPGCRAYRFYADLEDPGTVFLFEEWESEEALATHFASAHMAAFQKEIPRFVAGPPSLKRYAVTAATGM